MDGQQVDDEGVAAPAGNHVEVAEEEGGGPGQGPGVQRLQGIGGVSRNSFFLSFFLSLRIFLGGLQRLTLMYRVKEGDGTQLKDSCACLNITRMARQPSVTQLDMNLQHLTLT